MPLSDPEKRREYARRWYKAAPEHRERKLKYLRNYREAHRAETAERNRRYYETHPFSGESPQQQERRRAQRKLRYHSDLNYRLRAVLRARLHDALIGGHRAGSAVRDLGCSVDELRLHLEAEFQPGMNWENWGKGETKWNIDHIRPLASFDLTSRDQFLRACHYTNLQPLWQPENARKSDG